MQNARETEREREIEGDKKADREKGRQREKGVALERAEDAVEDLGVRDARRPSSDGGFLDDLFQRRIRRLPILLSLPTPSPPRRKNYVAKLNEQ